MFENKEKFVKEFGDFLYKYNIGNIYSLEYYKDNCTNKYEYVTIYFNDMRGKKDVNVMADSYEAIIRDVLKALWEQE